MKELVGGIDKIISAFGTEKLGNILEEEIPIGKKLRAHIKDQ